MVDNLDRSVGNYRNRLPCSDNFLRRLNEASRCNTGSRSVRALNN